jgi:hypothetical protein
MLKELFKRLVFLGGCYFKTILYLQIIGFAILLTLCLLRFYSIKQRLFQRFYFWHNSIISQFRFIGQQKTTKQQDNEKKKQVHFYFGLFVSFAGGSGTFSCPWRRCYRNWGSSITLLSAKVYTTNVPVQQVLWFRCPTASLKYLH